MPELPEVEITMQKLTPLVGGRRILAFATDWPKGFKTENREQRTGSSVVGRKILGVERRGKVLFFKLSGKPERRLAVRLGMSGRLIVAATAEPRGPWVWARWTFDNGTELRFVDPRKFGIIWYGDHATFTRDGYLGRLGPDAAGISRDVFVRAFAGRRAMIKTLLLRQDLVAGIGNILADEALWRAKVNPETVAARMPPPRLAALHRALAATIRESIAAGGSTLRDWGHPDGTRGAFRKQHRVYGRAGLPCPRCRAALRRIMVAGRGTTICPACQPRRIEQR